MPLRIQSPTVGDIDGDGRDEIIGIGLNNALLTIRLRGSTFKVSNSTRLTSGGIGSLVWSRVRGAKKPELLMSVDTRPANTESYDTQASVLLGARWQNGAWKRTWRRPIKQEQMTFDLRAGDFLPSAGEELIFEHGPSDVSSSYFQVMRWNGKKLFKAAEFDAHSEKASGLQSWLGSDAKLGSGPRVVVAQTIHYPVSAGVKKAPMGALMRWNGRGFKRLFSLQGQPMAFGDIRGNGRTAIMFNTSLSETTSGAARATQQKLVLMEAS